MREPTPGFKEFGWIIDSLNNLFPSSYFELKVCHTNKGWRTTIKAKRNSGDYHTPKFEVTDPDIDDSQSSVFCQVANYIHQQWGAREPVWPHQPGKLYVSTDFRWNRWPVDVYRDGTRVTGLCAVTPPITNDDGDSSLSR